MPSYVFSQLAEDDLTNILEYTYHKFGKNQMYKYKGLLKSCIEQLSTNHNIYKTIQIDKRVIRSLHCHKHIIFALERQDRPILIVAILHEQMDFMKRILGRL